MSLLFLLDGPHALYRCCHAHADLTYERDGVEHMIGGVYGFIQMLRLAHSRLGDGDAAVVVAWEDPERSTRSVRRSLYPQYKRKTPSDQEVNYGVIELRQFVREQREILEPILSLIGVPQAYAPGWEADDVIATIAGDLPEDDVVIFTGDKDMLSLVSEHVAVMRPLKEGYELIDKHAWTEEHIIDIGLWPEVLALAGDDSDNIPGVKGIGFKTAEKLLREHGNLEGVLRAAAAGQVKRFGDAIDKDTGERKPGPISMMAEQIQLNLKLTTLNGQVDLVWTQPKKNEEEVERAFREMKFHSFSSWADRQMIMGMGTDDW